MLENLLFQTVTINRPSPSSDSSFGETDTYSTVYTAVPCAIQPVSASWLVRYQQRAIDVSHTIYFNQFLSLLNGDVVEYGSRQFVIQGFRNPLELGRIFIVDCKELNV